MKAVVTWNKHLRFGSGKLNPPCGGRTKQSCLAELPVYIHRSSFWTASQYWAAELSFGLVIVAKLHLAKSHLAKSHLAKLHLAKLHLQPLV